MGGILSDIFDSAAGVPTGAKTGELTVEIDLQGGGRSAFYVTGGAAVDPVVLAVDPAARTFSTFLYSNTEISPPNSTYIATFKRFGTVVAVSDPFIMVNGGPFTIGQLAIYSDIQEGQLSGRQLGYAEVTATPAAITSTTPVALSLPVSVTIAVGTRPVELAATCRLITNATANAVTVFGIYEGATEIVAEWVYHPTTNVFSGGPANPRRTISPTAGTHTYQVMASVTTGSATVLPVIMLEAVEH